MFISTFDEDALVAAFSGVKRPKTKFIGLVERTIEATPEAVADKIKLGMVKRIIVPFFEERKLAAAAWGWTRPVPRMGIDRLDSMRKKLNLQHLSAAEFCERVIDAQDRAPKAGRRCAQYAGPVFKDIRL